MPDSPTTEELITGENMEAARDEWFSEQMYHAAGISPQDTWAAGYFKAHAEAASRLKALTAENERLRHEIIEQTDVARSWLEAADADRKANQALTSRLARVEGDFRAYREFVERHTFPERARANGPDAVYSVIKHHPALKSLSDPEGTP